ncbi:MAG: HDOD domain-containing protein [Phycisphaerales bacterium]|nr:MAG: HDOD domain-containing protein [Phycisphaerales bacterium]
MPMSGQPDPFARFLGHPNLPSPTGVALEVLALADREDATVDQFVEIIRTDPALVQRMLRIINSPFSGTSRPILDVRTVAILLGIRTVAVIALGISVIDRKHGATCRSFNYRAFWPRSLARAVAMERLCCIGRDLSPPEGFTLGLLSDMGALVLANAAPDEYAPLIDAATDESDLLRRERNHFGITRHELTARLLAHWGLPAQLSRMPIMALQGDAPQKPPQRRYLQITRKLAFANQLATLIVAPVIDSDDLHALMDDAVACGVGRESFEQTFDGITAQWRDAGKVFEVSTRRVPPAAEILSRAAQKSEALRQAGALHHFISPS